MRAVRPDRALTPAEPCPILARWSRNMPRPAAAWPHVKAYLDRMRARPGLREVHAREGLTDWIDD